MKIAIIIILYKTPKREIVRLEKEIKAIGLEDYKIYFINNTFDNRGYAAGVNEGIKKGLKDGADIFIIANPDVSLTQFKDKDILEAQKYFDIWGYAMKQRNKIYYGGIIDPLRLTGGLSWFKPRKRFSPVNWVSGSLMAIKKEVIEKIGMLDEKYFMYYEDVDYCLRAKKANFKIGIDSGNVYKHFEWSATNQQKSQLLELGRQKFFRKFGGFWQNTYETIHRLFSSSFFSNFISLNFSSLLIKFFYFILFIFLIRYFRPEEYGIYTLVWALIGLLSPLLDFGTTAYGIVYLPVEPEKQLNYLFSFRLFLSFLVFFLTILLTLCFGYKLQIIQYVILTSFVIFSNMFSGSYLILNSIRGKIYLSSIVSIIFNLILVSAFIISLILSRSLTMIFIIIFIFYNLYSIVNFALINDQLKNRLSFIFNPNAWSSIIKKSYPFVLISFFAGLYFKLDVFLLNLLKGEREVGIYSAGYKFLEALMFLPGSYNISSTPILARLAKLNKNQLINKVKKDISFLFLIGFSISLLVFIVAPHLLPLILKNIYSPSIKVTQIVIFALPLILLSSVLLNTLYVLDKVKIVILIFVFQTIFNLILNIIFIPRYSFIASSYITVISELVNFSFLIILIKKYL